MSNHTSPDMASLVSRLNSLNIEEPQNPSQPNQDPMKPTLEAEFYAIFTDIAKTVGTDELLEFRILFSNRPLAIGIIDRVVADMLKQAKVGSDGQRRDRVRKETNSPPRRKASVLNMKVGARKENESPPRRKASVRNMNAGVSKRRGLSARIRRARMKENEGSAEGRDTDMVL